MTRRRQWFRLAAGLTALTLLGLALPASSVSAHTAPAPRCDRGCLLAATNDYLEALLHNDPSRLKLAPKAKATDLGQRVAAGHGALWGAAVRLPYRQTWADADTHSAMFFGTATNTAADTWWWYELRLTFTGDRIAEIEEIEWAAPAGSAITALREGDPLLSATVPAEERSSGRDLIRIADAYWDALGSASPDRGTTVPFHPDCQRVEMGNTNTNSRAASSCVSYFEDTTWRWTVDNRRYYVVDETRGLVAGIGMFHPANPARPAFAVPEVFKIEDGLIRKLVANFNPTGVQTQSGWPDR